MAQAVPIILASTLKGAVIRFAISLAVSYLVQRLFGEPPGGAGGDQKDPGIKQRIPADPSNKLPVVYGNERVFGSIIFADITDDNQTMAFIIALCEGPINHIGTAYWDDYELSLRDNGWVHLARHPDDGSTDNWLNDRLKIVKYPDGGRCAEMEAFSSKWNNGSENRQMPDVAYVYVELKYDRDKQVTGLTPKLGFNVEGKLVRRIVNETTTIGPEPREIPLRDQINLDIFDKNLLFSDFQGRQITHYSTGGIFPDSGIGKAHSKVVPGGTIQIIDMGDQPGTNTPAPISDYINNGNYYGSGAGAMVRFHYVEPGEHHTTNHSSNQVFFGYWQPTSYTDPVTGVVTPDDGYRIINGMEITSWGSNYSNSNFSTGSNQIRVWIVYTYTDLSGATHKATYPLATRAFNQYPNNDEQNKTYWLSNMSYPYGSDPYNYGYRRKVDPLNRPVDVNGNVYQGTYLEHQQFFTAKIPYMLGEDARGYYSSNPAECLLDYLTNKIYGCGLSIEDDDIDLETFYDHKVFCDDLINYIDEDGNSQQSKRYECNGFINTGDDKDLNISDIVSNSQSIFSYTLGKFQMKSDTTGSSQMTFNDSNIYGDVTIVEDGFNSNLNELTLRYKARSQNYQDDQVFLDYDERHYNEPILSKEMNLKFIGTNVEAERLGTVLLNKSRSSNLISFKTDTNAAKLQVNDVITVEGTYYNLDTQRILRANLYNPSNDGTQTSNNIGQFRFYDYDEGKNVVYRDGTEAIVSMPYNVATQQQLLTFFKECINGQYQDTTFTLTKEQERQNNKIGELVNLVTDNEDYTTGGDHGGGLYFYMNPYQFNPTTTSFNDIRILNINNIFNTSWSLGVEQQGSKTGSQFKVNSISETELDGGLQGYYITAQQYNPADYTVATLTARPTAPTIRPTRGYMTVGTVSNLVLNNTYPSASIPYVDISFDIPNASNVEGVEVSYSDGINGSKRVIASFNSVSNNYTANSTQQYDIYGIPTTADLYIWVKGFNSYSRGDYSSGLSVGAWNPVNASTNVGTGSVTTTSIQTGAVGTNQLSNTLDFSTKTVVLADNMKNTPSFNAYLSSDQTIPTGVETKLEVDTEEFDDSSSYDNATNFRFTPTVEGKYYVYAQTQINSSDDFDGSALIIKKNGSAVATHAKRHEDNEYYNISKIVQLNGTTDYVEVFGYQNSGSDKDFSGGASKTYFGAYKLIN